MQCVRKSFANVATAVPSALRVVGLGLSRFSMVISELCPVCAAGQEPQQPPLPLTKASFLLSNLLPSYKPLWPRGRSQPRLGRTPAAASGTSAPGSPLTRPAPIPHLTAPQAPLRRVRRVCVSLRACGAQALLRHMHESARARGPGGSGACLSFSLWHFCPTGRRENLCGHVRGPQGRQRVLSLGWGWNGGLPGLPRAWQGSPTE